MNQAIDMNSFVFTPDPDLVGKPIRLMDAHRKYDIPEGTIWNWTFSGIVNVLERSPKLLILDESTVAKAAAIFKQACQHTTPRKAAWVLKKSVLTS